MEIEIPILYSVVIINIILGAIVLSRGFKNIFNLLFGLISLAVAVWSFAIIGFYTESLKTEFNWIALTHSSALFSAMIFLFFSSLFPRQIIKKDWWMILPFSLLMTITYFLFFTQYILGEITGISYQINAGYLYYQALLVALFTFSYIFLFIQYRTTNNKDNKEQLKYIIIGTVCSSVFGTITNLTLPALNIFSYTWMGPMFTFILVISIFVAILRHKLFNIKVIITEFISIVIIVALSIEVFIETDATILIAKTFLLILVIIFSFFLVRGVYREIELREKVEKLANDLKLANQGQSSLMHFMNHQVKGRLGNVKNIFAELLTDDYGELPPDAKPLLEKGLDEAGIGVNYVQNILKGASAENGTLPYDMRPIDLKSVVADAFEKQKDRAEKKELKFELNIEDGGYSMTGDAIQLGESIRNLIDNSLNYTLEGDVTVSLSNNPTTYRIEIKDTGVGLSSEDKLKLFKSGGRGEDSLKINVNSTGYGLVFVKGVVSAHGGKVWAESEGRGKGSTFIVELPKKS